MYINRTGLSFGTSHLYHNAMVALYSTITVLRTGAGVPTLIAGQPLAVPCWRILYIHTYIYA